MLDTLFGWRKASKCKKLIKMLKCRVKLLKNKRCCIVRQLREDVAELLEHGHHQTAFERVEHLIIDERVVQLYDLLDQFCDFILFHLPYIRKSRDCPNDINEAVSTLIFSSARFGELPELILIRKLFGKRYGQRCVISALELRPGNLVNNQIKENLYIKLSDELKHRMLAEIASSCMQQGPLCLEYKQDFQQDQVTTAVSNQLSCHQVQMTSADKMLEEMMYLDDIEEIVLPVRKDGNLTDQRLFMFKSLMQDYPLLSLKEGKIEYAYEFRKPEDDGEGKQLQRYELRAMTMSAVRPKESLTDNNIVRSISFPREEPRTGYSPCRHIHPKLPDYDEVAAKFKALKTANL